MESSGLDRPDNAQSRRASRQLTAVPEVRRQAAPRSQQEKNGNREEELGDWLTFPAPAVAVGLEAAALMASGACDERGEPPGGHPHFRLTGRGRTAGRRRPAGSPETPTRLMASCDPGQT